MLPNFEEVLGMVFATLLDRQKGCLIGLEEIGAVGHRVVHGRDLFTETLHSPVKIMVIPTNEEIVIARSVYNLGHPDR